MNQSVGNCSYFNEQQPMYNAIRCSGSDCFAMWQLTDGRFELLNKGCWKNPERCESNLVRNVLFCCCKSEFCNRNMDAERCFDQTREQLNWRRIVKIFRNSFASIVPNIKSNYLLIMGVLVGLLLLVLVGLYLRSFYKRKHVAIRRLVLDWLSLFKPAVVYDEKRLTRKDSDLIEKEPIEFENGSHAALYKGNLTRKDKPAVRVAIKVFGSENEFYFKNELQLYLLPKLKHENVLRFVKAKKVHNDFWLITAYEEQSSLLNFLRRSTLNLNQLVQICLDIARALAHLHGQNNDRLKNNDKLIVAHLDIKPANILLSSSLNARLCDFELSRVFRNSKPLFVEEPESATTRTIHNQAAANRTRQAGTTRYLAPEVLGGLLSTTETPTKSLDLYVDSLLKTDIYSCSLVYWEVLNCLAVGERAVGERPVGERPATAGQQVIADRNAADRPTTRRYRMVFEHCKSDDELVRCVVTRRERPRIEKMWRSNCLLNLFCQTMEECWEHEPKKRLTSARLHERLKSIHNSMNRIY